MALNRVGTALFRRGKTAQAASGDRIEGYRNGIDLLWHGTARHGLCTVWRRYCAVWRTVANERHGVGYAA